MSAREMNLINDIDLLDGIANGDLVALPRIQYEALEAERSAYRDRIHELDRQIETLRELRNSDKTERDAIRRKTIEECAKIAEDGWVSRDITNAIRALAQTDENNPETEK